MSLEERERAELFELLVPAVGRDAAVKLVDVLPPAGEPLATQRGVDALEQRLDLRFQAVDQRFEAVDQRFEAVDQRFDAVDQRFTDLQRHMDDRFDAVRGEIEGLGNELRGEMKGLRNELLAAFRGELVAAVSGQSRQMIVATATAVFGIGGLAVTLARLL